MKKQKPLTDGERLALKAKLLALPMDFLFNSYEASIVTDISVGALSNRRAKRMWPYPYRIPNAGRLVRYRHADLLAFEARTREAK